MAKAISSASEVLAAITGKTELLEWRGITLELRSLPFEEVARIQASYGADATETGFQLTLAGISQPKIDEAALRGAPTDFIIAVGTRVAEISGMMAGDRPLAGSGLPSQ